MYGAAIHAAKVGHQWPLALSMHDEERMWVNDENAKMLTRGASLML